MGSDLQWVRPKDLELDLFGLTHIGRVRRENQDHFMLCTVHPLAVVHGTRSPQRRVPAAPRGAAGHLHAGG